MDRVKAMDTVETDTRTCKSCQHVFEGRFCNRCGEKVIEPKERSVGHFIHTVFHTFTHADTKIFKDLRALLLKPGLLSLHHIEGVRKPHLNLVSIFFVGNLIYFLFPLVNTFNTPMDMQIHEQIYSEAIRPLVEQRMREENTTFEEFAARYDAKTSTYSKLMLIIFVPMLAVVFSLLNFRKDRYFADHVMAALEFMCFTIYYVTLAWPLVLIGVHLTLRFSGSDFSVWRNEWILLSPGVIALVTYFVIRLERTFYNQKWLWAVLKGAAVVGSFTLLLFVYRLILFFVTFYSV